MRQRQNNQKR